MPLAKTSSKRSLVKNIKTEIRSGRPLKQAVAIAFSVKKAAKKKGK